MFSVSDGSLHYICAALTYFAFVRSSLLICVVYADQRDIEDSSESQPSSASTPSPTPRRRLATGSIKIKHAADFPDNVTTANNAKLTLGRRAKAKDTLWTRDLALDEDGDVVNTVSGERFTLGLVAPKQEDKCMTFDVAG